MISRGLSVLALVLAAPAFAQSDDAAPDTTVTVPHWPEEFGADSFLHWSHSLPFSKEDQRVPMSADSLLAMRTAPGARAEAAVVDPGIIVVPDSSVDARMRLLVPPAHADEEMMLDPGSQRSPVP